MEGMRKAERHQAASTCEFRNAVSTVNVIIDTGIMTEVVVHALTMTTARAKPRQCS